MLEEHPEDAITKDEITGMVPPKLPSDSEKPNNINAFTELMSRKRKSQADRSPSTAGSAKFVSNAFSKYSGRDGLGAYIASPEAYPSSRVLYYNSDFVVINDMYPKSSVHTLLLPRSTKHTLLHPFDAFADAEFLTTVKEQTQKLRKLVASELRRKYGAVSKADAARESVLNGEVELAEGESMPAGRDWEKDVIAGIHAHPSMNHLHVHVLSVDRFSECLKHRKHYNSFSTEFLVPLEDFPLAKDDRRRTERYLEKDFLCWRCGKNFENRFARLKEHLAEEFEAWKKE